jgi:hypothetical protein
MVKRAGDERTDGAIVDFLHLKQSIFSLIICSTAKIQGKLQQNMTRADVFDFNGVDVGFAGKF